MCVLYNQTSKFFELHNRKREILTSPTHGQILDNIIILASLDVYDTLTQVSDHSGQSQVYILLQISTKLLKVSRLTPEGAHDFTIALVYRNCRIFPSFKIETPFFCFTLCRIFPTLQPPSGNVFLVRHIQALFTEIFVFVYLRDFQLHNELSARPGEMGDFIDCSGSCAPTTIL